MKRFLKFPISISLIVFLAALLRFSTLQKLMVFTPDEEYILYIVQTLVKNFHVIWIGVSALGFDFYMGPGWLYFLYPFVALVHGDPLVIGIISSTVGVITVLVIYWFGSKAFGKKVGIMAALFYAASALLVYYDQQPYPTGVPLLSLGLLISLYMTKKSKYWWVAFSLFCGVVFHIHLSLVVVVFVGLYWLLSHRQRMNTKVFILSGLAFIFAISPLIVFDYFHKGSNITAPLRVIEAARKSGTKFNLGDRMGVLAKAASRIWYLDVGKSNTDEILYPCNTVLGNSATKVVWPIAILVAILSIVFIWKKDVWKDEGKRLLILFGLAFLIPFLFLSSIGSVEYYLLGFFPVLMLALAVVVADFSKKNNWLIYLILAAFVAYNVFVVLSASGDYGLTTKKTMVAKVMNVVGDSSYYLSEDGGTCQGTAGWRYLFLAYARRPENSSEDRIFSWLWPDEVSSAKAHYSVEIVETRSGKGDRVTNFKSKIQEGGFTAFIVEN